MFELPELKINDLKLKSLERLTILCHLPNQEEEAVKWLKEQQQKLIYISDNAFDSRHIFLNPFVDGIRPKIVTSELLSGTPETLFFLADLFLPKSADGLKKNERCEFVKIISRFLKDQRLDFYEFEKFSKLTEYNEAYFAKNCKSSSEITLLHSYFRLKSASATTRQALNTLNSQIFYSKKSVAYKLSGFTQLLLPSQIFKDRDDLKLYLTAISDQNKDFMLISKDGVPKCSFASRIKIHYNPPETVSDKLIIYKHPKVQKKHLGRFWDSYKKLGPLDAILIFFETDEGCILRH